MGGEDSILRLTDHQEGQGLPCGAVLALARGVSVALARDDTYREWTYTTM